MILNNSIKLCIVSATMELDDIIYRRFYNCIDEDITYPFNFIINNINYNHYYYTKNVVDRRIHIAPPNIITNFKIQEYYLDFNPLTYEDSEKIGIDILKKIVNKNNIGNILFFSITKEKINSLVILLNNILPPYCIAIPYYSKMNE